MEWELLDCKVTQTRMEDWFGLCSIHLVLHEKGQKFAIAFSKRISSTGIKSI